MVFKRDTFMQFSDTLGERNTGGRRVWLLLRIAILASARDLVVRTHALVK